ncbi:TolC family protein [Leptonema illini]|uniref:Outer membrane efflux protein n=1 Tax=Leptonema illini DSM 21528 TaxID=929563 RepID=H2CKP4_9LEPT|nr:TolC family protein [Leptonema illini]EHQ05099.1 outer membrane efflux protein [Leptonema illini DSM 21528]
MKAKNVQLHCAVIVCLISCCANLSADSTTSYSIEDIEALAEKNSVTLQTLRLESELTQINELSRFRDFFPTLSLSYRRNRTIAQRDFDTGSNSVQLSISQPIYDGGRSVLAHEIAQIDSVLHTEKMRETKEQLRLQVRQNYFEILQAEQNVSILNESLKQYERFREISEVEYRNGNIAMLEILEIRNQLHQRKMELLAEKANYQARLASFKLMLRLPEETTLILKKLDFRAAGTEQLTIDSESMVARALERRPDIRKARLDLYRAHREFKITEYHFLPTVSLTGNYGKSGNDWPPQSAEWGVGINVTMNIFGNTVSTDYRYLNSAQETSRGYSSGANATIYDKPGYEEPHLRNQIELLRAKDKLKEIEQAIRNELSALNHEYNRRRVSLRLLDSSTAIKEQRFKVSERLYRDGDLSLDEFNKQEIQLQQARLSLVQERFAYALFIYRMELSLGLKIGELGELPIREAEDNDIWRPATKLPENENLLPIPELMEENI